MIETLDKVDKDRRCFRLVGGVLVERKVGEVEPALIGNSAKVTKGFPVRKVVIEEWLVVSSSLVGFTASHPTYYNLP